MTRLAMSYQRFSNEVITHVYTSKRSDVQVNLSNMGLSREIIGTFYYKCDFIVDLRFQYQSFQSEGQAKATENFVSITEGSWMVLAAASGGV